MQNVVDLSLKKLGKKNGYSLKFHFSTHKFWKLFYNQVNI